MGDVLFFSRRSTACGLRISDGSSDVYSSDLIGRASALGESFAALEGALFRMEVLERTLVAIPSGQPAHVLMLSSSYGYRHDPFTGASAMHAGLDFPGPLGPPDRTRTRLHSRH